MSSLAFATVKTQSINVKHATQIALEKNPNLAQIHARYQALKEVPSQVSSLPDPMVSIGSINFPTDTFNRAQEAMTNIQVGFTQDFPYPGKLDLRGEIAEFEATASMYNVEEARLLLADNTTRTWWKLYYLDRALETIDTNQALLRQFTQIAEEKYTTGKGLQQDVLLAQLELSKLTDQEIQVIGLRKNQNIILNLLMGRDPSQNITLGTKKHKKLSSKMTERKLYALAEEYRPILKREETRLLASGSRLALAEKEFYPDFKVSLSYGDRTGYNPNSFNDPRSDLLSLRVGIKVPLYYKTKQSKAVQQRFIEQQGSSFALENEKLRVMSEISKYYTDYKQTTRQLQLYETGILPQARLTVQSMRTGYQVSKVDFLNLVRSQVTLFNYELLYWKVYTESMQALSGMQAKVGKVKIYE
ncbi:MAG: transporter [Sulfurovum sp.]|nr:MAG: transporter [Sulfurovum sp.]